MIRITVDLNQRNDIVSLQITGHADSAPYGKDLVCAGVSAVAITGLNAIDELFPDACDLVCSNNRIRAAVRKPNAELQTALLMLATQLRNLAEDSAEYVTMETRQL